MNDINTVSLSGVLTSDITRAREIISKQVEAGKDSTGHLTEYVKKHIKACS